MRFKGEFGSLDMTVAIAVSYAYNTRILKQFFSIIIRDKFNMSC